MDVQSHKYYLYTRRTRVKPYSLKEKKYMKQLPLRDSTNVGSLLYCAYCCDMLEQLHE